MQVGQAHGLEISNMIMQTRQVPAEQIHVENPADHLLGLEPPGLGLPLPVQFL
jgi:hypothetical protein